MVVTAMPEAMSMKELPSTSTSTPPPAYSMYAGRPGESALATAASRRAIRAADFGPGSSVTMRRTWGRPGPPAVGVNVVVSVML